MNDFKELKRSLETQLPTRKEAEQRLKDLIAEAEAYGVLVAEFVRIQTKKLDDETAQAMSDLRKGVTLDADEDGNVMRVEDEEAAKDYAKLNAEEKKAMVAAQVSDTNARLKYALSLENLIKRRVSVGQSLLKSMNNEE